MKNAILILENMTLRMNCIEKVNDPKESSNRDFTFYIRDKKTSVFFSENTFEELEKDLTQRTFAICCVDSGIKKDNNQHENAMLPNLWAYYGENHQGACLVLNKEKINEKIIKATNGKVLYSGKIQYLHPDIWESDVSAAYSIYLEDLLSDKDGYFDDHIKNNVKELFFTKQIAWRDELEFRWVARSRSDKDYIDIDLTDCIELIVIGSSSTKDFEGDIAKLCHRSALEYHKAHWRTTLGKHKPLNSDPHFDFDGAYFSLIIPSACVVVKAIDKTGACQPFLISGSDGATIHWGGDETDESTLKNRAKLLSLEWTDCDEVQSYRPVFSASRLAKSPKTPLNIIEKDGKAIPHDNEEQPYYRDGFTYKPR